jgi:SAM-dependent methyltransferase
MLARIGRSLAAYHRSAIGAPRARRIARSFAEQIGRAESLLDVGCGDGRLARAVAGAVGASAVRGVDVKLQPETLIEVSKYDGRQLPFSSDQFEVVLLSDVLHHATEPTQLLAECLRVARRAVALKDHLQFGTVSRLVLLAMDHVGNAAPGVTVRGEYLSLSEWHARISAAGGRISSLRWPVLIHDLPWRLITRSQYQFTALVEPSGDAAPLGPSPVDNEGTTHAR